MAKARYNKAYKKEPEKVVATATLKVDVKRTELDHTEWFAGDKVQLVKRTDIPKTAGVRYRIKGTIQWVKASDLKGIRSV